MSDWKDEYMAAYFAANGATAEPVEIVDYGRGWYGIGNRKSKFRKNEIIAATERLKVRAAMKEESNAS